MAIVQEHDKEITILSLSDDKQTKLSGTRVGRH